MEELKAKLVSAKDELAEDIDPLNQLADREVKKPEIEKVKEALEKLSGELKEIEAELEPMLHDLDALNAEVDDLLDKDKT